jgi:hypothetical protein
VIPDAGGGGPAYVRHMKPPERARHWRSGESDDRD